MLTNVCIFGNKKHHNISS